MAHSHKETITVAIAGINGRMGRASAHAITAVAGMRLVGAFGKEGTSYSGKSLDDLVGLPPSSRTGILVSSSLSDCLAKTMPDVVLDFTEAHSSCSIAQTALEHNVRTVIGTSGLSKENLQVLGDACSKHKVGAIVVPNFSVGAILMMHFAKQASKLFDHVEIAEMHHTGKLDAPSGTAMHTARKIAETDRTFNEISVKERELLPGARGARFDNGVRLHSLRLPGILSHQEVFFGGEGELLTIKHESFNTKCFTQGILIAIKGVMELSSLVIGLDGFVISRL